MISLVKIYVNTNRHPSSEPEYIILDQEANGMFKVMQFDEEGTVLYVPPLGHYVRHTFIQRHTPLTRFTYGSAYTVLIKY